MFHFPTFPPHTLCVQVWVTGHDSCRVSPFGNPRINAWLAAPRGFSQPPTSFFGSWCQGIHRAPLLTWPQRCSRPLCSSQDTDGTGQIHAACARRSGTTYGAGRSLRAPSPTAPLRRDGVVDGERSWAGNPPVPSGPNSVPGPSRPRDSTGPTAERLYWVEFGVEAGLLVSVPPLSPTPARSAGRWVWTRLRCEHRGRARRSLERR